MKLWEDLKKWDNKVGDILYDKFLCKIKLKHELYIIIFFLVFFVPIALTLMIVGIYQYVWQDAPMGFIAAVFFGSAAGLYMSLIPLILKYDYNVDIDKKQRRIRLWKIKKLE